ncbi:MAG: chromosome segregation protein [Peptococcaceae bacterium]|nr:chromosome segregation protein [Peptococcaceae bacterium]
MYLKRLEIQGFKSFADKTNLEFNPGITLVVGPNGSGKSNIADAIRWVLGEQSVKSLRGGKMEDVIFAGSDKRRPLGMSEVSLTIDNSSGIFPLEFNEVTVTRRLYRSGESDYLINRVPCRLKDVHELFMDTGVGREGFSIIGQGKVDEILSAKPEERRGLLEEAAGIVKYRHRKREAVRKLEDTEASLIRLSDIISELSQQEEPLAEQARIASIYQQYKEELDSLEIGLLIDEAQNAQNRLELLKNNINQEERECEALTSRFHGLQAQEEEQKLKLQQKEEDVARFQEKVYQENILLEKYEGEKKLSAERLSSLDREELALERELAQVTENAACLLEEISRHQKEGEQLKVNLQLAKTSLKEFENLIHQEYSRHLKDSADLETLKTEHFESLQEETKINNEIAGAKQQIAGLERQWEQLKSKKEMLYREKLEVTAKVTELKRSLSENQETLAQLEKEFKAHEERLKRETVLHQELLQQNRCLMDEKNNILSRRKVLIEMERDGQGYAQGVRELLQASHHHQLKGILGTVAQLIIVPKAYETAIEEVLGGSLQFIVTEDDQCAQEAIHYLKNKDKGRATFLPLNTIKGSKPNDLLPQGKGIIGRASELVSFDKKFAGIIEYLLGRVFVVEDLPTAVKKAKETGFKYRMVTLDGQLVNAGGSLTGGSVKANQTGILSRKRHIEELAGKAAVLEDKITLGQEQEGKKEKLLQSLQVDIEGCKQRMQECSLKDVELKNSLARWEGEIQRLARELESLKWQHEETQEETVQLQKKILSLEEEKGILREKTAVYQAKIQELQERIKNTQQEQLSKNEQLSRLRVQVATWEEKLSAHQKEEQQYIQQLRNLEEQKAGKEQELTFLKEKRQELLNTQRTLEEEQGKVQVALKELEMKLSALRIEKQNIQDILLEVGQELKQLQSKLKEKEDKIHQWQVQQSKIETALEAAVRRLTEQFSLEFHQAKHKGAQIQERRKTLQRINELKEEINALGSVNLAAIEEYARLKERLEFLTHQVRDMLEAKERLEQVIREMDQIMTRKFKETFVQVDTAFQEVFRQLFGGGRAQLILNSPENILETGVEIIAQPPGKKTQSLSLLSGGERALTAIALLLAILKVKPSPFCVLDEIEAALDEANVARFAQFLREFAETTQFILISHRKGTMEVADVLYGVTMEETGVSRLLSVKLADVRREAS